MMVRSLRTIAGCPMMKKVSTNTFTMTRSLRMHAGTRTVKDKIEVPDGVTKIPNMGIMPQQHREKCMVPSKMLQDKMQPGLGYLEPLCTEWLQCPQTPAP
jgi:hypothetical protein